MYVGIRMVTIAVLQQTGGVTMVVGADVLLGTLVESVRSVSFARTGYGMLFEEKTGETIAHPA
jgi:hypothetical protein